MPYKEEVINNINTKYGGKAITDTNFNARRKVFKNFPGDVKATSKLGEERSFKFSASFHENSNKNSKSSKKSKETAVRTRMKGSSTPDDLLAKLKKENVKKNISKTIQEKSDKGLYNLLNPVNNFQQVDVHAIVQNGEVLKDSLSQNFENNFENVNNFGTENVQYYDYSNYIGGTEKVNVGDPIKSVGNNIAPFSGSLNFTHKDVTGTVLFSTSAYQTLYVLTYSAPLVYLNGILIRPGVDSRSKLNASVAVTTNNIYVMISENDITYFYLLTKNFIPLGNTQVNKNSQEGYIFSYNDNCYYYQSGKLYNLMMNSTFKKLIEDDSNNVSITSDNYITTWNNKKVSYYQQTSKLATVYDTPYNIIYACNKNNINYLILDINSPFYPVKINWMNEVYNITARSILCLKIDTKIIDRAILPYYEIKNVGWFEDLLIFQNETGIKFYNESFNTTNFYPYYVNTLIKTTYNNAENVGVVYNGNIVFNNITSYKNGYLISPSSYPDNCGVVVSVGSKIGVSFIGYIPDIYPQLQNNIKHYISKGGQITPDSKEHKFIYKTQNRSYIIYNL